MHYAETVSMKKTVNQITRRSLDALQKHTGPKAPFSGTLRTSETQRAIFKSRTYMSSYDQMSSITGHFFNCRRDADHRGSFRSVSTCLGDIQDLLLVRNLSVHDIKNTLRVWKLKSGSPQNVHFLVVGHTVQSRRYMCQDNERRLLFNRKSRSSSHKRKNFSATNSRVHEFVSRGSCDSTWAPCETTETWHGPYPSDTGTSVCGIDSRVPLINADGDHKGTPYQSYYITGATLQLSFSTWM